MIGRMEFSISNWLIPSSFAIQVNPIEYIFVFISIIYVFKQAAMDFCFQPIKLFRIVKRFLMDSLLL